jgi:hypothetical protein
MMKLESSDKLFMGKMSCLFALLLMGFISGRTSFNSSHNQPVNVVQKIEKKNAVSFTGNKSDVPVTLIR